MRKIINNSNTYYVNYATTDKDLSIIVDKLSKLGDAERIALDTEVYPLYDVYGTSASALDPHTSRVRLISIEWLSNDDGPYVIDLDYIKDISTFLPHLKRLTKVGHNVIYDIKALKSTIGEDIPNWLCSMVAMTTLGVSTGWKASSFRGHSLKDLARDYLGINLDKTLSISDWNKSLSDEQILYAGMDVGAPPNTNCKSIVLEGFKLIEDVCKNDFDQSYAFDLDQSLIPIVANMEYHGLPINPNLLHAFKEGLSPVIRDKQLSLSKELDFKLEQRIVKLDNNKLGKEIVLPEWVSTLLNNNRGLVKYISNYIKERSGKELSNLQAETLNNLLRDLEEGKEMDDIDDVAAITLVKDLMYYKRISKLMSEVNKYIKLINRKTGALHTSTRIVGTSTGRMSSKGIGDNRLNIQQISTINIPICIDKRKYLGGT